MTKIEDLIKELCPNGVKFIRLGDHLKVLRGKRLTTRDICEDGNYPVYHGGIVPIGNYKEKNRNANTTMIINVGASAGTVAYSDVDFWSSDGCFCLEQTNLYNNRFLYHLMLTYERLLKSRVRKAGIPTLDNKVIESLLLPVPPLEVQCEIVHILDDFTLLSAELSAELKARQKQYDYYTYKMFENCQDNFIELDNIGEVTKLAGFEFSQYVKYSDEGNIIALRGLNVKNGKLILDDVKYIDNSDLSKLNRSKLLKNDILYTYVGTVGQVGLVDKDDKYYLAPNVARIRITDKKVLPKYVMYYLLTDEFKKKQLNILSGTSSMKNITMANIRKFKIPVPKIEEQERIINILEKFDNICNDICNGLPAEINARQKQYEYYRDKLLNFKELKEE